MSRLVLGRINTDYANNESPNFYVAGITDGDSGFMSPRLISNTNLVDTIYGDFSYSRMYKDLIVKGIPAVLVPTITPSSQYNRPSLRLNGEGAYIDHTHPRFGKTYTYSKTGNIVVYKMSQYMDEVTVKTRSKFPVPYLFTTASGETDEESIIGARYIQDTDGFYTITIKFTHPVLGTITVVSYPSYESKTGNLKTLRLANEDTLALDAQIVPDIVVLDENGNDCEYQISLTSDAEGNKIRIISDPNRDLVAYIRLLTAGMVENQFVSSQVTKIEHGLSHDPIIKPILYKNDEATLFSTGITYYDTYAEVIANANNSHKMVQYINTKIGVTKKYDLIGTAVQVLRLKDPMHPDAFKKIIPALTTAIDENGKDIKDQISLQYSIDYEGYLNITVRSNSQRIGSLVITSFPTVESNSDSYFELDLRNRSQFMINSHYVPDIVVLDAAGYEVHFQINQIKNADGTSLIEILADHLDGLTAYVRKMPDQLIKRKDLTVTNNYIEHNLQYYPHTTTIVEEDGSVEYFVSKVTHLDDSNFIVTVLNPEETKSLQYSVYVEEIGNTTISSVKLEADEINYATVVDFSGIDPELLKTNPHNNYFILNANNLKILYIIQNDQSEQVLASNYYDEQVLLNRSLIQYSVNPIESLCDQVRSDLSSRLSKDYVLDFRSECLKSLDDAWTYATSKMPDGEPGSENFDAGAYQDWKEILLDRLHLNEVFLGSYKDLVHAVKESLSDTTNASDFYEPQFELLDKWYKLYFTYTDYKEWALNAGTDYWQWVDSVWDDFDKWNTELKNAEAESNISKSTLANMEIVIHNNFYNSMKRYLYNSTRQGLSTMAKEVQQLVSKGRSDTYDTISKAQTYDGVVRTINRDSRFTSYKLLLLHQISSYNLNFYKLDGLKIYTNFNAEQDTLCNFTENDKLIEFYSKIKGSRGAEIKINIEKLPESDYYYELTISLDNIVEVYDVYTTKTSSTPNDAEDIRLIGFKSELVDVRLFDYRLDNNRVIPQMEFIDYLPNDQFDPEKVIDVELPSGEYNLRRVSDEYVEYEDYRETLQLLSESGYHPDLFLSTKIYKETPVEQVKDTYSLVRGSETNTIGGCCEKGVFSQALVTLPWWYFQNAAVGDRFVDRNNRMLYFYEDMTIDGVQYPSYYPYIEHIIRGTVLKIPTENVLADRTEFNIGNAVVYRTQPYLIYDISESGDLVLMSADGGDSLVLNSSKVTKMDSLLDEYKINYLKYNNLYYYYLNLYEKLGQPTIFIVQFLCSKVSRGFLDWGRGLISSTRSQRLNECQGIIVRLINCMSYVSSLDFVMEDDANDRISNITTNLQVKGLVNKVFTVNYMLNLT